MADLIPINFPLPPESAIVSYDYTDISEGTGVVVFDGYHHKETTNDKYGLTINPIFSNNVWTSANAPADYAKIIDLDFDLPFNTPKRIRGKVKINCSVGIATASGDFSANFYVIGRIRKWDGSTETELFNAQSETKSVGYATWKILCFEIDCSTITNFKAGETLRATIEVWADNTSGGSSVIYIAHDPKNRVDAYTWILGVAALQPPVNSQLIFHIPFVLDL